MNNNKTARLWQLRVTCERPLEGHQLIRIEPALNEDEDDAFSYTLPERLAAARYLSGIMARAALSLLREHDTLAQSHRCSREPWDGACSIDSVDARAEAVAIWESPVVEIVVPQGKPAKEWLGKIQVAIAAVLEADTVQPTARQLTACDGAPEPAPQTTRPTIRSLTDQAPAPTRKESAQP